jgi:two-component system, OmpR family, sensor histidine kinase BaeS
MIVPFRSLRARLFLAHLLVIAIGAVTLALVAQATAPTIFDFHMTMMRGHQPMGSAPGEVPNAALQDAFRGSLDQALLVGGATAVIAALIASAVVTRQIADPVQRLAAAARRLATGRYAERVPAGETTELDLLTGAFNEMAAALEQSEARRLQLIGDVAHELRTPISTLEGYLDGLADGVVEPDEETWVLLREEAGRVRRLVEDLHALWRTEAAPLHLDLAPLAPAALIESSVTRLGPDFAAKGLTLTVDVAPDLPMVRSDADRALQVLTNLLGNALRYTPAPGEVTITAAREGEAVLFSVCDTGAGLAAEDLTRVFDRFYRVDKSRSRAAGGSGVGLAIARALVEAMGGRIWAASPGPDRGATFSFTLPIA